ncbi:hypothetical protein MJG53_014044 [Ovis ammon polii x Ovis aries]|uniref:Uncharacterized protein n=1 Tax=Ovis ammon polii x Ovis aries TaxID=2918886 RepID=A0ACB9UK91_9CETA|nr:hypothetical protein MJG53_014044 [Ovis ammon polii x Ovis aries]
MQAWRLAALPGLLCPSAGQPAFLFIGAAGGLQAAYRKRCLEKQEAFEAQGRVASEMSIGETSGRSLKGDSRLRADPLSSGSWAPGPAVNQEQRKGGSRLKEDENSPRKWNAENPEGEGLIIANTRPKDRQHLDGTAAGPLLPTRRRAAPRGPDAEQRSTDTRSVSPGLVPDGCKQEEFASRSCKGYSRGSQTARTTEQATAEAAASSRTDNFRSWMVLTAPGPRTTPVVHSIQAGHCAIYGDLSDPAEPRVWGKDQRQM